MTQSISDFSVYAAYRHLQFPSDDLNDDEVTAGISMSGLPAELRLAVDAYYSFEADGFFTIVSVFRGFTITDSLGITAIGEFGINQGYVSDGHDGANHFALTLVSNYQVRKSISIVVRLTQSWAIGQDSNAPGDETLVDFFNGGIGIQWSL